VADRFSCAEASRRCGEPRYGTASQVRRWVLIEQPGPWGADAVVESRLPADVAGGLQAHARHAGARVLLIRRHGRYEPVGRSCFVAVTTPDVQRVERFTLGHPSEVLDLDWSALRALEPLGGEAVEEPVFLVCTNGKHDACCAEHGRPLAHAMTAAFGDQVWESSHFGGDRFAGNLVCLPHGIYYGHVAAVDGPVIAARYAKGHLDLDHFRGRSSLPFAVQAGEYFLRRREGLTGVDDVVFLRAEEPTAGRTAAWFEAGGRTHTVTVEVAPADSAQRLTCKSMREVLPPHYREVTGE
jgi:hypothetical protein